MKPALPSAVAYHHMRYWLSYPFQSLLYWISHCGFSLLYSPVHYTHLERQGRRPDLVR